MKCKRCSNDFTPKFPHQDMCGDCDPWKGHKLCDGNGCFELFVPSKAQIASVSFQHRPMWYCPKCRRA